MSCFTLRHAAVCYRRLCAGADRIHGEERNKRRSAAAIPRKWRPTSAAEARNIESFTIAAGGLSEELSGAFVKYEVVRQAGDAVVLRVISTGPGDDFSGTGALAFSLETVTVRDPASNAEKARQILWIYWCESLDQLKAGLERAGCSKNGYMR